MTHCLQLDVGNSSAKWRLLQSGEVVARGRYVPGDENSRKELLGCAGKLDDIWISSVASDAAEADLRDLLFRQWGVEPWFARTAAVTGGLRNSYADPSRMGVDRWLAMLGAWQRIGERVCVIDAGSALTIDLVDGTGCHEGGYIIPGPLLMERALLLDTDRVRFEEEVGYDLAPGNSTAEAVRHGIALAQVGAIRVALEAAGLPQPGVLICGGGGEPLLELMAGCGAYAALATEHFQYVEDLVFEGLEVMANLSA